MEPCETAVPLDPPAAVLSVIGQAPEPVVGRGRLTGFRPRRRLRAANAHQRAADREGRASAGRSRRHEPSFVARLDPGIVKTATSTGDLSSTGLQLRNIGPSACTLYGYPGISWVAGADGHQVGAAAVRHTLASAPLDFVAAAAIPRSQCKPVPVRGLRVYPPGGKAALFLPLPTPAGGGSG